MTLIRVDTKRGFGHLMRCKWLGLSLLERGQDVRFIFDDKPPERLVKEIRTRIHIIPGITSEKADALALIEKFELQRTKAEMVIVDSYTLDVLWEKTIKSFCNKLVAIDDLNRTHISDFVVDAKWDGENTIERYKDGRKTQQKLLLGPDFSIINPEYQKENKIAKRNKNELLVSLGGGGDWEQVSKIIEKLLFNENNLRITVIIGDNAIKADRIEKLSGSNKNIILIKGSACLAKYYRRCTLFFGALGTSLYELAATRTPALTFSIAENQQNNQKALDDLAHYFHVDDLLNSPISDVTNLLKKLIKNAERLALLRLSPRVTVDGNGASLTADKLLEQPSKNYLTQRVEKNNYSYIEKFSNGVELRRVFDSDINNYLEARNRASNTWRMTRLNKITKIEHYVWWFSNTRSSFVLEKDNQPLLFIWHELHIIDDEEYLIGGWFSANDDTNFIHADLALNWQLAYTFKTHPKATWLAVINKNNKFVYLLNKRAGFEEVSSLDRSAIVIQSLFPFATESKFYFLKKYTKD